MLAAIEPQFIEASQLVALLCALSAHDPQPRGGPRDCVVPRVRHADHQRLSFFVACNHGVIGEHETGPRTREARENQPGHHRKKTHSGEDFDRRDQMPIVGLRMHVAIADRRQRLDREVEISERSIPGGVGDRLMTQGIKEAKHGVEHHKHCGGGAKEYRPIDGHRAMIEIAPKSLAQAEGFDLPVT